MIRRTIRRGWLVVAVPVALFAILLTAVLQPLPGGPLQRPTPVNSLGFPVDVGSPFTFGLATVTNPSGDVAVLDRLELVGRSPGLGLIAARVLPIREAPGQTLVANSDRWPPPELADVPLYPLRGWRFRPSEMSPAHDINLVLGLRVSSPGEFSFDAIALHYQIANGRYRAVLPYRLRVCAPTAAYQRCPEPGI